MPGRRTPPRRGTYRGAASAVYAIKRRHGMRDETGQIARCWPDLDEQRGVTPPIGTEGKVAFPSREVAQKAAAELAALSGTDAAREVPQRAYECPRRRLLPVHYHLTSRTGVSQ